jgi:hypothetical protein
MTKLLSPSPAGGMTDTRNKKIGGAFMKAIPLLLALLALLAMAYSQSQVVPPPVCLGACPTLPSSFPTITQPPDGSLPPVGSPPPPVSSPTSTQPRMGGLPGSIFSSQPVGGDVGGPGGGGGGLGGFVGLIGRLLGSLLGGGGGGMIGQVIGGFIDGRPGGSDELGGFLGGFIGGGGGGLGGLIRGGGPGGGGRGKNPPTPSAPPSQPATGPGGNSYPHKSATITHLPKDENGKEMGRIIEPADPMPSSAPIFIFIHSAGASHLNYYREMMEHIAKHGMIVIYPYIGPGSIELCINLLLQGGWGGGGDINQTGCFRAADELYAVNAIKAAFNILQAQAGHVQPDLEKVGYGGHSLGGDGALTLAGHYSAHGLPKPQALMVSSPCPVGDDTPFANIPSSIKMLVLNGDSSTSGGVFGRQLSKFANEAGTYTFALKVWANTAHISNDQRDFIIIHSDKYGTPGLRADHVAIYGSKNVTMRLGVDAKLDALDWNAYWKLSVALLNCAFKGVDCGYALGNTPEQTDMGNWGDGTPVRKLEVTDNPSPHLPL